MVRKPAVVRLWSDGGSIGLDRDGGRNKEEQAAPPGHGGAPIAFTAAVDERDEVTGSGAAGRLDDGRLEIEIGSRLGDRPLSKPNA